MFFSNIESKIIRKFCFYIIQLKAIRIRSCNLCAQIEGKHTVIPGLLSGNNFPIRNGYNAVPGIVEMAWQMSDSKRLHMQLSN
jgi:hypothetical protein